MIIIGFCFAFFSSLTGCSLWLFSHASFEGVSSIKVTGYYQLSRSIFLSCSDSVTKNNKNQQMLLTYIFLCVYMCLHKALQFMSGYVILFYLLLANSSDDIFIHKKWLMESTGVDIREKWARAFVWKCLEGHSEACGLTRQAELVSSVS